MTDGKNNKEKIDLSDAFKDSNIGSQPQDKEQLPVQLFSPEVPKITRWVIKYSGGLIKNEQQANYVLLFLSTLAIIISLFLFFNVSKTEIPPEALENPDYGLPIKD